MSHVPQIIYTQNSSLSAEWNSNPLIAFTRPSRNSPLPYLFFLSFYHLLTQICHSRAINRISPPEYAILFHIFMPLHLLFPLLKLPSLLLVPGFWCTPTHCERVPICSASGSHPNNCPRPFACANLPPIIYSITAFITPYCNNLF